ncbi:MAG TPA: N-formylglutamate amidohydrolase, partial [Azospirillum sp.]|nr:N-formylglutamate amidohydrolase [Azospirillum sp.]
EKSAGGLGLIRTLCRPGLPLYDGKLSVAEVAARVDRYYRPYHFQVASVIDEHVARFGAAWHVDCHSMPSGGEGADFVVGDRDGVTADRGFVEFVVRVLRSYGYAVAINHPYKGVELVGRYGDPARGRHSVQLEVSRRLYMNEETLEKHAGFAVVQRDLTGLIRQICAYAEARVERRAAE